MRKIGDLLKDLGFKEGSSEGAQRAFVRHLIDHANLPAAQNPSPKLEQTDTDPQLSFDAEILGPATAPTKKRKTNTR